MVGIQGLARYWFEIDGTLFLSNKGDLTGRIEAEYDLRLTQYLILQPRAEVDFSLQDIPESGTGAGLSTAEIGRGCVTRSILVGVPQWSHPISASTMSGHSAIPPTSGAQPVKPEVIGDF